MEEKQFDYVRYILFVVLVFGVFAANMYFMPRPEPKKPLEGAKVEEKADGKAAPGKQKEVAEVKAKPAEQAKTADQAKDKEAKAAKAEDKPAAPPEKKVPDEWVAIGSADPASPYRMLVTLTNRGAAIDRIELNSPQIRELEDRSGYMGHVALSSKVEAGGVRVDVVGSGTPADLAGLKPGDVLKTIDGQPVTTATALQDILAKTRPTQTIDVVFTRNGEEQSVRVPLERRPLEVVRPEGSDPLSFLLTLDQIDDLKLTEEQQKTLGVELEGVRLREGNWEVSDRAEDRVTFRRTLPKWDLELTKTYQLAQVAPEEHDVVSAKAYHVLLTVGLRNTGKETHKVAYQLDGPTGLPTEGWWYSNKVWSTWSAVGMRDVAVSFSGRWPTMVSCPEIAKEKLGSPWQAEPLSYIGVDAQYFDAVLIPKAEDDEAVWFAHSQPLRVGPVTTDLEKLTNVSFRLTGAVHELEPGQSVSQKFEVFAGPKRPALLKQYGLGDLVYYGWFAPVAKVLAVILHAFYAVIPNYGIAIILLTALVRLCVFPLSKKQTLNAQKMQELQPELKKIVDKYKNNLEARNKAQQELFRKHNYHPLSGCLPMFIQLPVFVALYRLLAVDVELRQAPLISESIHWCSNLAAPDMLFDWSGFWHAVGWDTVNKGIGFFGFGPYFNLLPIITIVLFIWQQKVMMPPPADEQAAVQQKVMKFMMIFMGLLFFKVPSGLCIYFIASSLWGMAERRFLPKAAPASGANPPTTRPQPRAPGGDGGPTGKKKSRDRR